MSDKKNSGCFSRRHFLTVSLGLGSVCAALAEADTGEAASEAMDDILLAEQTPYVGRFPVLPPGAQNGDWFFSHCTGCQLCVAACPANVIQCGKKHNWQNALQPTLSFAKGFCQPDCFDCGRICPTAAISALEPRIKKHLQLGVASLHLQSCLALVEECSICAKNCPSSAIVLVERAGRKIPQIDAELCTGCGACEFYCPVEPAAIQVAGNEEQIRL